ncbi:unnamed protein product [Timema podura]|uniref:Hemimethylated DNA-binding domain-containing protein n=1 Tax=Timema podura TaxID=61482 RepID=A0ABN7NS44_TIMPD|nr:unnamed protein product [Timema podura]
MDGCSEDVMECKVLVVMPLNQREVIQLGMLLVCVPAQYFLSSNGGTSVVRSQALLNLTAEDGEIVVRFQSVIPPVGSSKKSWLRDTSESPAIEVLQYRERTGHFASSPEPRTARPLHLRYRVGQVVKHKTLGIKGVIIGWDLQAKAPESWLDRVYGSNQMTRIRPHYSLIVDNRDSSSSSVSSSWSTYVVQEELELVRNTEVMPWL